MTSSAFTQMLPGPGVLRNLKADFYLGPDYVFSDTAGTVPATINGPVRSVRDRSFNANLMVLNQNATYKQRQFGGYYLDIADGTKGVIAGLTPDTADFFVATAIGKTASSLSVLMGANASLFSGNYWYLGGTLPYIFGRAGTPQPDVSSICDDPTGTVVAGLWQSSKATLFMNTAETPEATGTPAGMDTGICMFGHTAAGTYAFVGEWSGAVIANSTTDLERKIVINYLRSLHTACRITCAGNSLTQGFGGETPYPTPLQASLNTTYGSGAIKVTNLGLSGQTILTQITDFPTEDQLWLGTGRGIVVFWGLVNDIFSGSITARQAVDRMWQFCYQCRQAGSKVIVLDCLPSNASGIAGTFEAIRVASNALVLDEWRNHADRLGRVSQLAALQNPADGVNYQADQLHLTTAGGVVVANFVDAIIDDILDHDWVPNNYPGFGVVIPSETAGKTTGYQVCYDEEGLPAENVPVKVWLRSPPDGDQGEAYSSAERTALSDVNGIVQFPGLFKGARYYVWRGSRRLDIKTSDIPSAASETHELLSVIGHE